LKQWKAYHQRVGDKPNSLVVHTLNDFVGKRRSVSLDLGAGNLRDSKFLLGQGFTRAVAVDSSEESLAFVVKGIELYIAPIETFTPGKNSLDFAFSCNTLFFLTPAQVADVFRNVLVGLRPGGIFACNVLGQEDDWVVWGENVSSFTEETIVSLCSGFRVLGVNEGRNGGSTVNELGFVVSKFWHQLSIVVQKI
jgi:SAM-dependent methyltransferase